MSQLINERYDTYAMADIMVETHDESLRKTLNAVLCAIALYQKNNENGLNKQKTKE